MMERSCRNRKFSLKYRIEKWFYEDSKNDCKKIAVAAAEMFSFVLMLAILGVIPALFH